MDQKRRTASEEVELTLRLAAYSLKVSAQRNEFTKLSLMATVTAFATSGLTVIEDLDVSPARVFEIFSSPFVWGMFVSVFITMVFAFFFSQWLRFRSEKLRELELLKEDMRAGYLERLAKSDLNPRNHALKHD